MTILPQSARRTLALLLSVGTLWTEQPSAAPKQPKLAKTDKPPVTQTIELGNVGEKTSVNIKQVQGVDPKDHAKALDMLAKRDADARKYEQRVAELEVELQKARASGISRVLVQAAQPEADDLAKRARAALFQGDSALAEQLLRKQEERAAITSEAKRREAAQLAREIAALAIGRDSQAAMAALERAAKYEPEDFWTLVQLGDAQAVLGQSAPAMANYQAAHAIAQSLSTHDSVSIELQANLLVSHERIGNVLVAQGDGPGALAAYRKDLAIAEALAARDPTNTRWQSVLSINLEKIGDVLKTLGDGPGALAAYRKSLAITEALTARDSSNTEWQVDVAVSCANLGGMEQLVKTERRAYLLRGLDILRALKYSGRLLSIQDWTLEIEDALRRLNEEGA